MIARLAATLAMLAACALPAAAQGGPEACRTVKDDKARLTCFDTAAWPEAVVPAAVAPAQTAPPAATADNRARYATVLEQNFLKTGGDISVMSPERPSGTDKQFANNQYPRLILFARISKPFVFQMVSQTELLKTARQLGFKVVEFMDKGPNGRWYYDVSGTGELPRCDTNRGLCF